MAEYIEKEKASLILRLDAATASTAGGMCMSAFALAWAALDFVLIVSLILKGVK